MKTEDYLLGFIIGFIVGRISKRSLNVDKNLQLKMLDFLKSNQSFTVNEFIKTLNDGTGFLLKSKIRLAASDLAKSGQIDTDNLPNSSFLNRDDTVKFSRKRI